MTGRRSARSVRVPGCSPVAEVAIGATQLQLQLLPEAQSARRSILRRAGQRYQASGQGRGLHAIRQARYRDRRARVTHQASVALPGAADPGVAPRARRPSGVAPVAHELRRGRTQPAPPDCALVRAPRRVPPVFLPPRGTPRRTRPEASRAHPPRQAPTASSRVGSVTLPNTSSRRALSKPGSASASEHTPSPIARASSRTADFTDTRAFFTGELHRIPALPRDRQHSLPPTRTTLGPGSTPSNSRLGWAPSLCCRSRARPSNRRRADFARSVTRRLSLQSVTSSRTGSAHRIRSGVANALGKRRRRSPPRRNAGALHIELHQVNGYWWAGYWPKAKGAVVLSEAGR